MATKSITCKTHGGTFSVPIQRGRPRVNCTPENPCNSSSTVSRVEQTASAIKNKRVKALAATDGPYVRKLKEDIARDNAKIDADIPATLQRKTQYPPVKRASKADRVIPAPESVPEPRLQGDGGVSLATAAKERLEPLGWNCNGRKFLDPNGRPCVRLIATRGEELLTIVWCDGKLHSQDYSLWNIDQPKVNGKPADKLKFDIDMTTDRELMAYLSGAKVTWWNSLAQSTETAVISPGKISIEHVFTNGNELPSDRIVKFLDMAGSGFRSFRVGALLKVG